MDRGGGAILRLQARKKELKFYLFKNIQTKIFIFEYHQKNSLDMHSLFLSYFDTKHFIYEKKYFSEVPKVPKNM